jgi:putative component of membrane protein insertase Oxa1/YidC/SpoIIIJ protein YidD
MPFKLVCSLCLCLATTLGADPWGKDADLCQPQSEGCRPSKKGPMVAFSEIMIGFHQNVISPADGPRSHYKPSSSQYTLDAIRQYGFLRGFLLGCDRLMRENNEPWVYRKVYTAEGLETKYDPVK